MSDSRNTHEDLIRLLEELGVFSEETTTANVGAFAVGFPGLAKRQPTGPLIDIEAIKKRVKKRNTSDLK